MYSATFSLANLAAAGVPCSISSRIAAICVQPRSPVRRRSEIGRPAAIPGRSGNCFPFRASARVRDSLAALSAACAITARATGQCLRVLRQAVDHPRPCPLGRRQLACDRPFRLCSARLDSDQVFALEPQFGLAAMVRPASRQRHRDGDDQQEQDRPPDRPPHRRRGPRYALSRSTTNTSGSFGGIVGGEPLAP